MSGNEAGFSADFFNNSAAVFAILIFTKSVSYRSYSDRAKHEKVLHGVCVVVASLGLVVALLTTEMKWTEPWTNVIVWLALIIAGIILVWDEITLAPPPRVRQPLSPPSSSTEGKPPSAH